tara:strand:+ start:7107 stop:7790 length:684 start_codon:yes stop_codon:yes gene_type:complete
LGLILNIETSTKTCSIAIGKNGVLISEKLIRSDQFVHGEKLHLLIKELFNQENIQLRNLDAIAISSGPGSFTGLRIGVASAKGLAYAIKKPLISVVTTDLMMECYHPKTKTENSIFFPMIDARREEVYTAGYDLKKNRIWKVEALVVNQEFFKRLKDFDKIYFIGEGAGKFKNTIQQKNIFIDDSPITKAKGMLGISNKKLLKKDFEDLAYFNPFYLKDFTPHKKNS